MHEFINDNAKKSLAQALVLKDGECIALRAALRECVETLKNVQPQVAGALRVQDVAEAIAAGEAVLKERNSDGSKA